MNLEPLKNAVTSKAGVQLLRTKKHSPTIFFVGGVVGVVGATVLACKATLKVDDVLQKAEEVEETIKNFEHPEYSEDDRSKDLFKTKVKTVVAVSKLYAPAATVGVVSIAALTGSHIALNRRNTALMAAYSALDKGFKQYRDRVREEFGDEKDLEFRHGSETVIETIMDEDDKPQTKEYKVAPPGMPSIYARWFDEGSRNWSKQPEYNNLFLNSQQNYANDLLRARGHIFLNEVYDMLGIPRSKEGAVVGWVISKEGDNFVDFGVYDGDNERKRRFVNRDERSILLDFNVDGVIYDLI